VTPLKKGRITLNLSRRSIIASAPGLALPPVSLGAASATIAAIAAAATLGISEADAYRLTTHHQLYGPSPGNGEVFTMGALWSPLTALTANSKEFYFDYDLPPVLWAAFTVVWFPASTAQMARMTRHYVSPSQTTTLGEIVAAPSGTGPVVQAANVTAGVQECRTLGTAQYLMASYWLANQQCRLYESRLTILWDGL
jgi:hypothetical protein